MGKRLNSLLKQLLLAFTGK